MENNETSFIQKNSSGQLSAEKLINQQNNLLNKRIEKLTIWLKKPNNLILTLLLILAFAIRLYYFYLTKGQAVWWDASEYLNMARAFAFGIDYEFYSVRPILFSLIIALFFKIGSGEFLARVFIFSLSFASVLGMYLLGKELYNRKVGLICAFLMSIFSLALFFTYRVMVDLPSMTFFVFSAYLFFRYIKKRENKILYLGAVVIGIGTLMRITTATFLFVFFIFVLVTEKLSILKRKEYWIAGIIFILVLLPYIIWGYVQFGVFIITESGKLNAPEGNALISGFNNIISYSSLFKFNLTWPLLIFFYLGLISMYKLILGFDILIKGKDFKLKRDFFLLLLFLVPFVIISTALGGVENRYVMNAYPAILIISGAFLSKSYNLIKKNNKIIAIILLMILLSSIMFLQLKNTDTLIKSKISSYIELKQAGLWLKGNSEPSDIILSLSPHQIKYYSERAVLATPRDKEEFESLISSNPKIKFFIISIHEPHEQWMYPYPQENNFTAVQAYFADANQQQPVLVIYRL